MSEKVVPLIKIQARRGWQAVNWSELVEYRDLFYFLVWRDIKVRYAQSVLGIGWALVQPVFSMIVFTVIFGKLARVPTDGIPQPLFYYIALVPWTYFQSAMTEGANSLQSHSHILSKVYFPRLILPMNGVLSKLVDFFIALLLVFVLMAFYQYVPTATILIFPLLVILMMVTASGLAMWLSALSIQYRDIRFAMGFVVQLLMYASPVVYPLSLIPEKYRFFYALNPMASVIEGFRASLLGSVPVPWNLLAVSTIAAFVIFLSGMYYFRRMERIFSDVV